MRLKHRKRLLRLASSSASAALASHKEKIIAEVLDLALPGWTFEEVKKRCHFGTFSSSPVEILCLDTTPLIEFYPLETILEGGTYKLKEPYRVVWTKEKQ